MPCHLCDSAESTDLFESHGHRYQQCRGCGLIARSNIAAHYASAEYRDDSYQRLQAAHQLRQREAIFHRTLDELARTRTPGRILDVGCGDGLFLKLAADRGWEVSGVELSPMAAAEARRRLGGADDRIICDELAQAHFSDGYFDVVTLFNVLDQVAAPLAQAREIHRVLKPGGLLLARVPNATFHANLLRLSQSLEPQLVLHLYSFSPATLRLLLERAGFGAVRIANSPLTPGDPYGASPLLGAFGMGLIKRGVYASAQAVAVLSGARLMLGPSLMAHAVKL